MIKNQNRTVIYSFSYSFIKLDVNKVGIELKLDTISKPTYNIIVDYNLI